VNDPVAAFFGPAAAAAVALLMARYFYFRLEAEGGIAK
jgi:hypothetical protein